MTYEDALDFHIREFDRQVGDMRSIMLQPDYDNAESPEVVRLRRDILQIVTQTFLLKQTHARAVDFKQKQAPQKMNATDKDIILRDARQYGDELHLDFWYPRNPEPSAVRKMVIGLSDVRAADGIRVSYDFDRDGWKIEQASTFSWDGDDEKCDPDWQEVAFVEAWAREKPETAHE